MSNKGLFKINENDINIISTMHSVEEVLIYLKNRVNEVSMIREKTLNNTKEIKNLKVNALKYKKSGRGLINTPKSNLDSLSKRANAFRQKLIKNKTLSETSFEKILKDLGLLYTSQKIFFGGESFFIVDFYLNDYKYVIEIDGGYHDSDIQKIKDITRTSILKGTCDVVDIIRFSNEETKNLIECKNKLLNHLHN